MERHRVDERVVVKGERCEYASYNGGRSDSIARNRRPLPNIMAENSYLHRLLSDHATRQ